VWAAQGSYVMPVVGMVAFSTAFASPFFFLAMFPSLLAKLPKSGGWMNSVKVTMGLLELAIVTKFLSVADTGFSPTGTPQYLDYHLVMGSWIAVAAVTGFYLLGMFRMGHDSPNENIGPLRCIFSLGFFGLAAYIAVGLFSPTAPQGALWQQIVAFAPPQISFAEGENGYYVEHDGLKYSLDFDAAVKTASSSNKPLFLDFTGVNCINCRRMEEILAQKEFHAVLKDLVLAQLYVDEVPGVKTNPEEHERILSRNHGLQENWFADVTIPAYVIATPDGKEILATFKGLDTSGVQFREFLSAGLTRWDKLNSNDSAATAAIGQSSISTN
jgi:thiol:disulfide interchange protein